MTERCELCGRAYALGATVPFWFPHQHVCDRRKCRAAVRDAILSLYYAREEWGELADSIAARHEAQHAPVAYRGDTMAKMDVVDDEDWWALDVVKRTDL
jgi:hypothetical protein